MWDWKTMLAAGAAFAVAATLCNGLVWGLGDHDIIAAFHGERLVGDLLEHARDAHPTLLWPVLGVLPAPWGWNVLHLLSLTATGAALWALGQRLGLGRRAWWLLALLAPAQIALGGAPTLDPMLLPRGVALPIELAAVVLGLRGRWAAAWLLVGAAICLHAPSATALGSGLLVAWWPERKRSWIPVLAIVTALPVAIAHLGLSARSIELALDGKLAIGTELWWNLVQLRLAHHADPTVWPWTAWWAAALWLTAAVWGVADPRVRRLGLGLLAWMVVVGGASVLLRIPILVNLEPWQVGRFLVLGGALGLAARAPRALLLAVLVLLVVRLDRPRWLPTGPEGDIAELAAWARDTTDSDALFLVPPDLVGFRALARRPVYGTIKDGGELQFDSDLAAEWLLRMELICDGMPADREPERRSGDRRRRITARAAAAYDAVDPVRLGHHAREDGVTWVVRRVDGLAGDYGGVEPVAQFGSLAVYDASRIAYSPAPRTR